MIKTMKSIAAICMASLTLAAQAAWPERQITIVVPYPAGNSSDVAARIVGERLSKALGQPVVVENRAGASGTIGTAYAGKQAPDGYTLLLGAPGPLSVSPYTYANPLPYDSVKDFVTLSGIAWAPQILVVRKDMPVKDLKELVAYSKQQSKPLLYGTAGIGTTTHVVMSELLRQTGLKAEHVPYKGGSQAITDVAAGHIDFTMDTVPIVAPMLKNSAVKPIAVSTAQRIPAQPSIPSLVEQGVKDMNLQGYIVMSAPAKTPEAIVKRLSDTLDTIQKDAEVRKRLAELGLIPMELPRSQVSNFIEAQSKIWKNAVDVSGAAKSVQ